MIALLLLACSGGGDSASAQPASMASVIEELGQLVWSTRYSSTHSHSVSLHESAAALCTTPSSDGLADVRERWWAAKAPWKESDALAFGPYSWTDTRLGPAIDGWPADVDWLSSIVDGDETIDADLLATLGSTTTGFPALGWLLYGDGSDTLATEAGARRCALSTLLAERLASETGSMEELWAPGEGSYLDELINPGPEARDFETLDEVEAEVFNRMLFVVEDLRETRLGKPLGIDSGGLPQPDAVEAPYSGRSLQDTRDSLRGVQQHWTGGDLAGEDHLGMVDRLPPDQRDALDEQFMTAVATADAALAAVPEPLSEAVDDAPALVQEARDALREVQVLLQVDIAQALQVTVQFNDSDGD